MAKVRDRYASALFEISIEANSLEKDLEYAIWIRDSLNDEETQVFLTHPAIPNSAKSELLQSAFSDKVSEQMVGFLYTMIEKNRESLILETLDQYIELVNKYFGKIKALVVSAKVLTSKQIESISKILSKKTDMEVSVEYKIDPDVIAGFYVLLDGRIYDNTIRSELNSMKKSIYKGTVVARVVSAKPLKKDQIQDIADLLSKKISTEVEIRTVVDPELLGGFYIVVDGHFYDGTVRTRLKDMKKSLKKGKLEW